MPSLYIIFLDSQLNFFSLCWFLRHSIFYFLNGNWKNIFSSTTLGGPNAYKFCHNVYALKKKMPSLLIIFWDSPMGLLTLRWFLRHSIFFSWMWIERKFFWIGCTWGYTCWHNVYAVKKFFIFIYYLRIESQIAVKLFIFYMENIWLLPSPRESHANFFKEKIPLKTGGTLMRIHMLP